MVENINETGSFQCKKWIFYHKLDRDSTEKDIHNEMDKFVHKISPFMEKKGEYYYDLTWSKDKIVMIMINTCIRQAQKVIHDG